MQRLCVAVVACLGAAVWAQAAAADPCAAIPDSGPLPFYLKPGASFGGKVVRVLDGDSLCVALGPTPAAWVEVRLADFDAPERRAPAGPAAKRTLERLVLGQGHLPRRHADV